LKTDKYESGMGTSGGGAGYPGCRTQVVADPGRYLETGSNCEPAFDVDEACVDREIQTSGGFGQPTGRWIPPFNTCYTFVDNTMEKCRRRKCPPVDIPSIPPNVCSSGPNCGFIR
jgi:hypothetical protein